VRGFYLEDVSTNSVVSPRVIKSLFTIQAFFFSEIEKKWMKIWLLC